MNYLQAIVLSIVEGITEFLPISSTGHLILTSQILKIPQTDFVKSFEIIIQLGAICSVLFLYHKTLLSNVIVWKKITIAFIPTAIIGFLLYSVIKSVFIGNGLITLSTLFLGGVALIILELIYREKDHHATTIESISNKNAFLIGLFQSIAVIPGVSRSASTIIGALFLGTKRKAAAEFSFLLAIPTMLSATGLDLLKSNFAFTSYEYSLLGVGFFGSFIVALITVKLFLGFIQKNSFVSFGVYRIIIAFAFWLILY